MSIDEANFILNDVVIEEASIRSQVYFSKDKIQEALQIVLCELETREAKIKKLEDEMEKRDQFIRGIVNDINSYANKNNNIKEKHSIVN